MVKAERINRRLAGQIDDLQGRINALQARQRQLEGRRIAPAVQPPATHDPAPAQRTPRQAGAAQAWKTSVPYQFWLAYKRQYKNAGHSQKLLSATCKAHGVDQTMPSVANLAKVHAILSAGAK